jgi:hypothetical protein
VATVLTPVAQVLSIELPDAKEETFEADTLDNPLKGKPKLPTGSADGGSLSAEIYLNPALHSAITTYLNTIHLPSTRPANSGSVVFPGGSNMTFDIAGIGLGATVALKDGLKGKLTAELDGMGIWHA